MKSTKSIQLNILLSTVYNETLKSLQFTTRNSIY